MRISVVVPVFNAEETLPACLESLVGQQRPADEILLVDNGSKDASVSVIEEFIASWAHPGLRLLHEAVPGPSAARNCGAAAAEGEVIAFTDADCVADPGWIGALVEAFDSPDIAAVAGDVQGFDPRNTTQKFLSLYTLRGLPQDQVFSEFRLTSGGFPTANLAVRKTVFEAVRGFDPQREIYTEDYDLCARLYQQGLLIRYTRSAKILHIHRANLKGLLRQSFGFGRGHACLMRLHFSRLFILELPGHTLQRESLPLRLWINLTSADKKMGLLLFAWLAYWPLAVLPVAYLLYLHHLAGRKLAETGLEAGFLERFQLAGLLLLKSAAMTAGKLTGALRYRVICL